MQNFSNLEAVADPEAEREYNAEPRHRHRDPVPFHARLKSLRATFFALAGFWGFTVGATAAVIALAGVDATVQWAGSSAVVLAVGAVAAVAGGVVASKAYGELKSRR